MGDILAQIPVQLSDGTNVANCTAAGELKVNTGLTSISVSNFPATQSVSGTVAVSNLPATQPVSGTVSVGNFPASQTVFVSNFPATQPVSGTVAVSGNVSTVDGVISTGVVVAPLSSANVAKLATVAMTYTVTSGKTLYLKQIIASSSSGPSKIVVDYGTGTPTVVFVGFYTASAPFLSVPFEQPIPISSGTAVNVRMTNNAGSPQDLFSTVIGREV